MLGVRILSSLIIRPGKIVRLKMVHKSPGLCIASLLSVEIEANSVQKCMKTPTYVTIKAFH
jgi:hypothetical protein